MGWVIFFLVLFILIGIAVVIWQLWEHSVGYSMHAYTDEQLVNGREKLASDIRRRGEDMRAFMQEEIRGLRRFDKEIKRRGLNKIEFNSGSHKSHAL